MSKIYKVGEERLAKPFSLMPLPLVENSEEDKSLIEEDKSLIIEREAFEKGFKAGERAGFETGEKKVNALISRLSSILDEILRFREGFYKDREDELVELVIAVAEKVIHAELSINRDVVINVIRAAIDAVTTSGNAVIKLNPEDLEYLSQANPAILNHFKNEKCFNIEGDNGVGKGGCIIQSNFGEVDARIEEGLKVIKTRMKEMLENEVRVP